MYITGLGNVKGIGPQTKIALFGGGLFRVRDLDDQFLCLWIPCLFTGESLTGYAGDNRKLRLRLKRLNPKLTRKLNRR